MTFSERLGEHIRHNVVGYIALFCFAIGGIAQALPGRNTVDSGDIKQGQVKKADLATGAVTNAKLAPDAVGSANVIDNTLTGGDIADESVGSEDVDNTLTGGDIADESVGSEDVENTERRILIPVGEINPPLTNGTAPDVILLDAAPAFVYPSGSPNRSVSVTTRIPDDRVAGTDINIDFVWSPATAGAAGEEVVWSSGFYFVGPGEDMTQGVNGLTAPPTSGQVAERQLVSTATITGGFAAAIGNGDLLVFIAGRGIALPSDDHPGDALLHLISVRYTAQR